MKKILTLMMCIVVSTSAFSRGGGHGGHVSVHGYVRNGTYVQPHFRTAPDGVKTNNWSYAGNVNPYTGKVGTNHDSSPNYSRGGGYHSSGVVYAPNQPVLGTHYTQQHFELHNTKTGADYVN